MLGGGGDLGTGGALMYLLGKIAAWVAQSQKKGQQSRNMGRAKSHHVPGKILVATWIAVGLALPA